MKLGKVDLSPEEYLLVYKRIGEDTLNTWTLQEGAFQVNYPRMKRDKDVEFVGIYKKLNTEDLLEIMCR